MTTLASNISKKLLITFFASFAVAAVVAIIVLLIISSTNKVRHVDLGPITIASIGYDSAGNGPIITGSKELPFTGAEAVAAGLQDPVLCSFGRGKFYLSEDYYKDSEYLIVYNYEDKITGLYLFTENIMPNPWLKLDELRGGGGLPVVDKEHHGLFVLFRDPNDSCKGSGKSSPQSPVFQRGTRTEYQATPTPTVTVGIDETLNLALATLNEDSRTFALSVETDNKELATAIESSKLHSFLSGLNNVQEGSSKWINNVSHRGISGDIDASQISNITEGSGSGTITVNVWINSENVINAVTIEGTLNIDGSDYTKLNISPQ
jgi:hypothetical protein